MTPARPHRAALLLLAVAALLALPAPASAHSVLDESTPAAGATVDSLEEIRLEFADPLTQDARHELVLSTIDDEIVATGDLEVDGATLQADVTGGLPETGEYLLLYTVVAGDGDSQDGGFVFAYDGPVTTTSPWRLAVGVGLVLVGGAALAVRDRLARPRPRRARSLA